MGEAVVVDVVVVGAGIAGASVAWRLAIAGRRVALVEAEATAGQHATGRSAAMTNVTSGHPEVCRLAALSRPFLADPPSGFADHPLLSPRGLLWVGADGTGPRLDALVAKALGAAHRLSPGQARRLVPTLDPAAVAAGAVHEPGAMAIDVASLLAGYLRGLSRAGGQVLLGQAASALDRTAGHWTVQAGPHRLIAPLVVNAGGAWADQVAVRAGVAPLGLQARRRTAALAALPEPGPHGMTAAQLAALPMVMDVAGLWYAEPETGGLLVSPADETPVAAGDARPEELDVALGLERAGHALGLDLRRVRRAWAGLRTFAPDELPVAGPDPTEPSFLWLAGQGGAGIKTAPALAELITAAVTAGTEIPAALNAQRFR